MRSCAVVRVRSAAFLVAATCILGLPSAAAAEETKRSNVRHLDHDNRVDLAVTTTGALWWVGSELLKANLVPEKCRWCYRLPTGQSDLNVLDRSIRRALKWDNIRAADTTSSVIAFAFMPASMLGLSIGVAANDGAKSEAPLDVLLITEATILAVDLNQLVKFAFARERPFVHYLPRAPGEVRALTDSPSDDNLSFYSGHTNLAFALAASSGTIALMRGYRLAPLVVGVGALSAASVAYLRIAADKHYFSDVMVGAFVGSIIGAGIPLLFHGASTPETSSSSPTAAIGQALPTTPMRAPFVIDGVW